MDPDVEEMKSALIAAIRRAERSFIVAILSGMAVLSIATVAAVKLIG